jgi:hypothetical protein
MADTSVEYQVSYAIRAGGANIDAKGQIPHDPVRNCFGNDSGGNVSAGDGRRRGMASEKPQRAVSIAEMGKRQGENGKRKTAKFLLQSGTRLSHARKAGRCS